jgi:DsbC/DsbD-like thiol-disulfide interchange protein
MTTGFDRLRPTAAPRVIAFCATVLIAASPATAADDASRWDGDARSAIRLVAGSLPAGQTTPMRAGLEIRLKPGWHTYWRYPGDAGVPPRFDFAGSQNVKAVEVLWPAPQRIPEEGMVAIGYTGDVMLPIAIVPQDVSKPVLLHLKLDYAVCEKLCVPAEGKAELLLTGGPSSQDAALAAAAAGIPRKVALGQGTALAIKSVRREEGGGRPRIIVDVAAPPGTTPVLFAEGPAPDWALPVPARIDGAPAGLQRFTFDLDGAPPGAKYEGAAITLTAIAADAAIEVATHLD